MSAKDLSFEKKYPIVVDDLKYDGKNLVIPSYWAESILDFVEDSKLEHGDADYEDLKSFRNFLSDIVKYNNK